MLIRGLLQLRLITALGPQPEPTIEMTEAFQTLTSAIQKNATCASFLAARLFPHPNLQKMHTNLSFLSIGRNNDCRGLDQLLAMKPSLRMRLFAQGSLLPPVLAAVASTGDKTDEEREQLLATAISGYGDHVPVQTLVVAADVKTRLQKWNDAAKLYAKAISVATVYGDNIPPQAAFNGAVIAYIMLEQWEKVVGLHTKAITAYGDSIPFLTLIYAAYAYCNLNQWEKSAELYTKAYTGYGDNVDPEILQDALPYAAFVYLQLEQWEKAAEFYTKAVTAYGDNVPPDVLHNVALVKSKLETISPT